MLRLIIKPWSCGSFASFAPAASALSAHSCTSSLLSAESDEYFRSFGSVGNGLLCKILKAVMRHQHRINSIADEHAVVFLSVKCALGYPSLVKDAMDALRSFTGKLMKMHVVIISVFEYVDYKTKVAYSLVRIRCKNV